MVVCSFCENPESKVRWMIQNHDRRLYICPACVVNRFELIAESASGVVRIVTHLCA